MNIWVAIDVDNYYHDLKVRVEEVKNELGIHYGTNNLPYHISLKISFLSPLNKENEIIRDIEEFYKTLKPFTLKTTKIEEGNSILWVRYMENEYLRNIAKVLNIMLNQKYNIPYHPFDIDYIFHTTLYMNEDQEMIQRGYLKLKDFNLPKELYINKFLIGYSNTGEPETYNVLKEIIIKNR